MSSVHSQAALAQLCQESASPDLDLARGYLSNGASPSVPDQYGQTPIYWASRQGHLPLLELLLSASPSPIESVALSDQDGLTALHAAARRGHVAVCQRLMEVNGGLVGAVDRNGKTALHGAAAMNQGEVARVLVARGASTRAKDRTGKTPVDDAQRAGHYDLCDILD